MIKNLLKLSAIFFILNANLALSQTKIIPYQELTNYNGLPTGSGIYFGASMSSTGFTLTFAGPSDRWIAFGLGTAMSGADAFIYTCGNPGNIHLTDWKDYKNTSSGTNIDSQQDWTVISNSVASGQRTVVATRALSTGDANDAVITYSASGLDVIWARGAVANYTMASHGTTNRRGFINLTWLSAPTASFSANTTTVCQGNAISFSNLSSGAQNAYNWIFDSGIPATSSNTNVTVTYTNPGTYSVSLTASNSIGTNTFTQINYITVTPSVAPSIAIGLNAGSQTICAGSNISFTAASVNGGTLPSYQWKVNGVNSGTNGSTFSTNALASNAIVNCVLSSNATCANPASISSPSLNIVVNSTVAAAVSITLAGGNNPMCAGSNATFAANGINAGTSPLYQWKKNNVNVGSNSAVYTGGPFLNGDLITCDMTSNSSCATSTFATSAAITVSISTILTPSVNLLILSGSNPACVGQTITYSAIPFSGGNAPTIIWTVNGSSVAASGTSYTSNVSNGAAIQCVLISNASCASPNSATSSIITMTVNPIPATPIISITGSNTICSGNTTTLSSNATGLSNWSNGATSNSIVVNTAGSYSLNQSINNCTSANSSVVVVSVLQSPTASLNAVPDLCKDDAVIILNGFPAGGQYIGNGVSGNNFNPSIAGAGNVQLVYQFTDVNGCSDTAAVSLKVLECTGLLKNAFEKPEVEVYPNPANKIMFIKSALQITGYKIVDVLGNLVLQGTQGPVTISDLKAGMYFMQISVLNATVQKQIIILHD